MIKLLLLMTLVLLPAVGLAAAKTGDSEEDAQQILAHINGIFRAYLDGDRDTIERMHTDDWVGFLGPSTGIERGIDAYMRNANRSLANFHGTGYELLDTEIQIHDDIAVVYYVARYDFRDADGREGSLPLRSVDIYRREHGRWNQSGSHITPIPQGGAWGEDSGGGGPAPRELSAREREELLASRREVWEAWFANDHDKLLRLVPKETIAIDPGIAEWADLEEILHRAEEFQASGADLRRLEFPRTLIQAYGDVAILYTEYLFEFGSGETTTTVSGRGTEVFVKRGERWLNSGWHLDSGG